MSTPSVSVKAEFNGQFRRFRVFNNYSLSDFYQTLSNVYQVGLEASQISIKYQDNEQDMVTIVKEEEWQEALRVCSNMKTLRVTISTRKKKATVEKVIEQVEHIVTGVVNETGKVLNKKTFDDAYESVKATLEENKAQEHITSVLDKCSVALEHFVNEMDKGVKNVIDQINPIVNEVTVEIDPNTLQTNEYQGPPKDEQKVEEVKPVETQQVPPPNMEQSWTFIEVNSESAPIIKRQLPKAKFIRDVTFEDHSEIECGTVFTKQWELQNLGNEMWPENVKLEFQDGPKGLAVSVEPVASVKPLEKVIVTAQLRAPETEGSFTGIFRLTDGNTQFGPSFWCALKAIKKEVSQWADELTLLQEMGFLDVEKNEKLLDEHKGDLSSVIQAHLNNF
jgi:nicotinamide mononucleotide adenylyltransferase